MSRVILASASVARAAMLRNAGVEVEVRPAQVDEASIKARMLANKSNPNDIVAELAHAKAAEISALYPEAFVIGADQILVHRGKIFDKPRSMAEARSHLITLRGSTHRLISSVAVLQASDLAWSVTRSADLTMRSFSDAFLDTYLETFGETALTSVGAYHLEGLGAQLFEQVDGDYFTILGLPLLELLGFLRIKGILPT